MFRFCSELCDHSLRRVKPKFLRLSSKPDDGLPHELPGVNLTRSNSCSGFYGVNANANNKERKNITSQNYPKGQNMLKNRIRVGTEDAVVILNEDNCKMDELVAGDDELRRLSGGGDGCHHDAAPFIWHHSLGVGYLSLCSLVH